MHNNNDRNDLPQKIKPQIFFSKSIPPALSFLVTPICGKIALLRCQYRCIPFTFVPKSEQETYFWKNVGGLVLEKALQLSEGQFNFKPTALATLPQTCNHIFLCWQITQKSNSLDIFLKNYYIIKAHATFLQRDFYHVI